MGHVEHGGERFTCDLAGDCGDGLFLGDDGRATGAVGMGIARRVTMAAYLVRPAFLFMLVLWPTLGPWMHLWVYRRSWITTFRRLLLYSVLTFGCFFGYCGLRMMVVGEFGFVSFAGYNLIGISGQYLTDSEVERLPEDLQELARRMIANRIHIDDYSPPDTFETMVFLYNATIGRRLYGSREPLWKRHRPSQPETQGACFRADPHTSSGVSKMASLQCQIRLGSSHDIDD